MMAGWVRSLLPLLLLQCRSMAMFGLLYLNDGAYDGKQIIPAEWVNDSLQVLSEDAWTIRVGKNFKDVGYGYQWWSARAGDHHFDLAWGHARSRGSRCWMSMSWSSS